MAGKVVPMTSGSIWKHITFFALPIMLGNLFQQLYTTVDSVIVGNFLGSSALAAVSSSGSLTYTLIGLLMGVASGAGVLVAQYFGAGNEAALHRVVHTTVAFGLTAGAVLTAVGVAMTPLFLTWMGTPEGVMPEATVYLRVYFAGAVGLVMYNIFVGILQAVGDSRHPLIYLIVCSVVNLAFSYCIASILRGSGRSMTPMLVMILCWCAVRVAGLSVLIPLTRDIRLLYFIYPFTWALSSVVFALLYRKSDWLDSALARHL